MLFYIIVIAGGILFLIFLILLILKANKLKVMNLKIEAAEKDVTEILKEKYDKLNDINNIMKTKDREDLFKDIETLEIDKFNSIELNKELAKFDKIIVELTDYNKEIIFDAEEEESFDKLAKININRLAIEKYYNDNVSVFNKAIDNFPSNIIAKFKKYDEKDLFLNEKEEIFEILKK